MARNLIPHCIQKFYQNQQYQGEFSASTMFLDISGFTAMTETLMVGGNEGAEILATILNQVFEPITHAIYARQGFIANFGGDAFTAIFPEHSGANQDGQHPSAKLLAVACAQKIQAIFKKYGVQSTKFGEFILNAKIGLAFGPVEWRIVGHREKAYFFRGAAIDACVQAEHQAQQGEILLSESFTQNLMMATLEVDHVSQGYDRLRKITDRELLKHLPQRDRYPRLTKKVVAQFFPDAVVEFNQLGEFRNVATLFIAFTGISTTSELDTFVSVLIDNSKHFSGYFNKIDFGDKGTVVLCFFGAPLAFERNIERALDFILAVRQDLRNHNLLKHVQLRVGMTYGAVYAGLIGGRRRCEYTAIGDAVNLAMRLMMQANWDEIWVSERIYCHAQARYDFEFLGTFTFKGKTGQIPAYRLNAEKPEPVKLFTSGYVGRHAELRLASKTLRPLTEGKFGGILYVYGEAGVGKSRFVDELRQRHPQFEWLYLPCDRILKKAFNPFAYFFTRFFAQSSEQNADQNQANFEDVYQKLIDGIPQHCTQVTEEFQRFTRELVCLRSIMAGFLGIHYPGSLYEQLDPKLRYQNTLYAFQTIFRALSLSRPVVVELEDIHWIDSDSIRAVDVLCQHAENLPLLFIATSRYEDDQTKPRLPIEVNAIEINLNALSKSGTKTLAKTLLPGQATPQLLETLITKTQGNPFFIEQTIRYFKEAGIVAVAKEKKSGSQVWDLSQAEIPIPATINDLLIARIDRLSEALKDVVQTAAVLGREFEISVLAEMLHHLNQALRQEHLITHLQEGVERRIWAVISELRCIFSHALVQDAVYRMQLKKRLLQLHQLAAEVMERLFPEDRRIYADIAFHYEHADLKTKAIEYLHKAGDFAKETYALELAIGYYHKALTYLTKESEELESVNVYQHKVQLYENLGEILWWQARYAEAIQAYSAMQTEAEIAGDGVAQARAWCGLSQTHDRQGDYPASLESAICAEETARRSGAQIEQSKALFRKGWAFHRLGRLQEALKTGEETLILSTELNDKHAIARGMHLIGVTYTTLGCSEQAFQYIGNALALVRELGDLMRVGTELNSLGCIRGLNGDYRAAVEFFQEALRVAQESQNRDGEITYLSNLSEMRAQLGEYTIAEVDLRHAIRLAETSGIKFPEGYNGLAAVCLAQGKIEEALASATRALFLAQEIQALEIIGIAWKVLGMAAAKLSEPLIIQGKAYDPIMCFHESLRVFTEMNIEREQAWILEEWAKYEMESGDRAKGEALWQEARAIFERLGVTLEVERMDRYWQAK